MGGAQTRNRIRDLVKPDDLSKRTRLVSINAFYFKDSWARPFFTALTTKMDFYVTSKDIHKVETMRSRYGDEFMFYECPHLKAKFLELFFGGEASMVLVLPTIKRGWGRLKARSTGF